MVQVGDPNGNDIPEPKPGWQTTEFWIAIVTQAVTIAAILFRIDAETVSTIQQAAVVIVQAVFALVTAGFILWHYISGRQQVKTAHIKAKMQQMQMRAQMRSDVSAENLAMLVGPLPPTQAQMMASEVVNDDKQVVAEGAVQRMLDRMHPPVRNRLEAIDPAVLVGLAQFIVAIFEACREAKLRRQREAVKAEPEGKRARVLGRHLSKQLRPKYGADAEVVGAEMVTELATASDGEFEEML